MSFGAWLPAVANLFFVWTPVHAHIYEDNLGGQISLLGPLVCFAVFIAICACFCRECRRREAMLASTTAVPADPFHTPGPVPYGPAVAGARPVPMAQPVHPPYSPPYSQPPAPSQSQPPPTRLPWLPIWQHAPGATSTVRVQVIKVCWTQ
ncbi:hypothetical protein MTO96_016815 [Rhipicephalus appendiculatus]